MLSALNTQPRTRLSPRKHRGYRPVVRRRPRARTHYNYFRDYDPQTGRYVESDPIGLRAGVNTYGYVRGSPIDRLDPLGLFDLFGFGSLTADTPGPVRAALEGVALGGYSTDEGFYTGDIVAGGAEIGGQQNYVAGLVGFETTKSWTCPNQKPKVQSIRLGELSIGPEIPFLLGLGLGVGRYKTDTDHGLFFFFGGGTIGDHGALGFGFSTGSNH